MMYCVHCGKEIKDDVAFCPHCGQPTGQADQPGEAAAGRPQASPTPRINMVMDIGKSPLVLLFSILMTAGFLFNLIGMGLTWLNLLNDLVLALLCIGCWFVYASCAQNRVNKTGFTLFCIGIPIYLVLSEIGMIIAMVAMASWFYGAVKALIIIIFLIVMVIYLWAFCGLFHTANEGRKILDGQAVEWEVGMPSLVVFVVLTVLVVYGLITNLINGSYYYYSLIGKLAYIVNAVGFVIAMVILFRIRQKRENG